MTAYAVVNKRGKIVKERVTEGRSYFQLCIFTTRSAARYYAVVGAEQVKKISVKREEAVARMDELLAHERRA